MLRTTLLSTALLCGLALELFAQVDSECFLPEESRLIAMASDPGVAEHFPLTGSINALIVFVQHRDDDYEQCLQMDGFVDTAGSGKSTYVAPSYEPFCSGRSVDGWDAGKATQRCGCSTANNPTQSCV